MEEWHCVTAAGDGLSSRDDELPPLATKRCPATTDRRRWRQAVVHGGRTSYRDDEPPPLATKRRTSTTDRRHWRQAVVHGGRTSSLDDEPPPLATRRRTWTTDRRRRRQTAVRGGRTSSRDDEPPLLAQTSAALKPTAEAGELGDLPEMAGEMLDEVVEQPGQGDLPAVHRPGLRQPVVVPVPQGAVGRGPRPT